MHKIKEQLMKELKKIEEKGELSAGSLDAVHKITDTIKNIDKIEMLEEGGYSQDGGYSREGGYSRDGGNYSRTGYSRDNGHYNAYEGGNSYARGRGRNAKRDSMGRYSRGGIVEMMEEMMEYADNEQQRQAIRHCMKELEEM